MKYSNVRPLKKSNEDWVESIPVDWTEKKLSLIFETIGSGTTPSTLEDDNYGVGVPWVTTGELRESRITRTQKEVPNEVFDRTSALKKFPVNSIAIAMYGATIGRLGIFGVEACTNQACCVLANPRNGSYQFHYYCFQAAKASIIRRAIGGGQPNINQDTIRALRFPNPSRDEQRQIAAYLNRETAKIDKLIAKQQKLIKLLREKRQAVISQAVTKGLDPNVKLKDSGVEWLGKVPEHWSTRKLCQISISIGDGLHGTPTYDDLGPVFFVNGNNLNGRKVQVSDGTRRVSYLEAASQNGMLKDHAVLLSINGTIGNTAIWDGEQIMLGKSIAFINPIPQLDSRYLSFFLSTSQARNYFNLSVTGTTISNLGLAAIRSMRVPLPTLLEQRNIVSDLNQRLNKFDDASTRVEQQKSLLLEHRQALITAAVTGKIDVRGLVTDEEVAALDADPVLETTEEDFESEVAEADYITEEE